MFNLHVFNVNKKLIAILEDEEEQAALVEYLMKKEFPSIECFFAENGERFQELFEQASDSVDLAILDVKTPPPDGVEVLAWLKENYPETKVAMLSSSRLEIDECHRLGCDGYYVKPYYPEETTDLLHKIFSRHEIFSETIESV